MRNYRVLMSVCLCVCLCVCVHNNSKNNGLIYLKLEHTAVNEIRAHDPKKLILHLHFTKSLKRDNVYKLCL